MLMTDKEARALVVEYYRGSKSAQRLGQFLMNHMPIRVNDSDLFYEEVDSTAWDTFIEKYTVASQTDTAAWGVDCDEKGFNKVDVEAVKKRISKISFHYVGTKTFCYFELDNGAVVEGSSGTVDPRRFQASIGRRMSLSDALSNLIGKFAFVEIEKDHQSLKEKLDEVKKLGVKLSRTEGRLSVTGLPENILEEKSNEA